jgi:hypothetical protein
MPLKKLWALAPADIAYLNIDSSRRLEQTGELSLFDTMQRAHE